MHELITIIYSIAFAMMFVNAVGIPFRSRLRAADFIGQYERIKPIDCEKCLAFWTCFLMQIHSDWSVALFTASISYVVAMFITKKLNG